jgi:hypothetical protein
VIAFRPIALRAAIEFAGAARLGIPPGSVSGALPMPGQQAVRIRYGNGATAGERMVQAPEMAAILIAYCLGARVPLPRIAAKTVLVTGDGVTLEFLTILASPPRYQRPR